MAGRGRRLRCLRNTFSVRESLQRCFPTSFSKVKFTEETWKSHCHEHEDQDLFVQILNRGVSFHGLRLRTRNWVFLYTPKELWVGVERLTVAANQNYHEGLGGGKNTQQNMQGGANRSSKKVNDTKSVLQECCICFLLGSTGRVKTHSMENHWWSAND